MQPDKVLTALGMFAVAGAAFYGIYRLAKWRMADKAVSSGSGSAPSSKGHTK